MLFSLMSKRVGEKRTGRDETIKRFFLLCFKIFKNRPKFQRKFLIFSRPQPIENFFLSKFPKIAQNFKRDASCPVAPNLFHETGRSTPLAPKSLLNGTFRVPWRPQRRKFSRYGTLSAFGAKNFLETGRLAPSAPKISFKRDASRPVAPAAPKIFLETGRLAPSAPKIPCKRDASRPVAPTAP